MLLLIGTMFEFEVDLSNVAYLFGSSYLNWRNGLISAIINISYKLH
jgi:hypothetical protein